MDEFAANTKGKLGYDDGKKTVKSATTHPILLFLNFISLSTTG